MPITAELFDGTKLEFPDDTDPSVIQSTAKRLTLERTPKKGGIGAAFESGVESYVSPTQTALESITGSPEEAAKRGLERQKVSAAKYEGPSLEDIKKVYQEQGFIPAAKKTIGSIPEAIAAQVPQIGAMGVGAGIGAIIGGALGTPADIVTGPAGTVIGAAAGAKVGQMIGQAFAEFPQFYGSNIERQAQVQMAQGKPVDINRLKAAGAAGFQTASDIFETQILFGSSQVGKLLGFSPKSLAEKSVESVEKMAKEKLLTTLAKGTAKGAAAEIPNEIFQQMLERAQAGLSVADADAMKEYGDTAYQVGLLAPLGIVGSLGERGAARREVAARGLTPSGEPIAEPAPIIQPTTSTAEPVTQAGVAPVAPPPIPKIPEITTTPTGMVAPVPPTPTAPVTPAAPVAPQAAPQPTPAPQVAAQPAVTPEAAPAPEAVQAPKIDEETQKELKDLYKERDKLAKVGDNLVPWLKKYGIHPDEKADMGIEKGTRRLPVGIFKKSGYGLDELARAAVNDGIITESDLATHPDEVEAFRQLAYDAIQGNTARTPANMENMAKLESIQSRIEQLENPPAFGLEQETAAQTQERMAQEEVARKAKEDEELDRIMAEDAERSKREIARRSEERAGEFALGQTPMESLTGQQRIGLDDDIPFERQAATPTPKFAGDAQALGQTLRTSLDKMGLGHIGLQLSDSLNARISGKMENVNGAYYDNMIALSLNGDNIYRTMNHEALHAMKDHGFFSDKDWKTLSEKADKEWMKKYDIERDYGHLPKASQQEEAIAKAFADYKTEPPKIKSIMVKAVELLKRIGNMLRGRGFNTAEDIFGQAAQGKLQATTTGKAVGPKFEINPTTDRLTKTTGVKSAGQKVQETVDQVNAKIRDDDFWTAQRVAFVDKNSGLAKDLASQPVFNMKGQLRADMLARTQDQILNYVHSGLQMGLPTINSDGTLGIEESENNLARSQVLADQLDKKGITDINGKKMSGRDAVSEVARILRGKDVLAEDKERNAKGREMLAQAKALTKELKRLQVEADGKLPVKTMREYLNAIKYLRKEGYLNKNLNRELQVKDRHIKWAEETLKNTPEVKDILNIWKNINDSLVTLWEKAGLFTKAQADEYRGRENYVPLFKAKEDLENGVNNVYGGAGAKSVKGVKKLQGSEAVRNIWENMNRHYASMVTAAYQNQTRKVATEQLKALGAAEIVDSSNKDVNLRYRDPTSEFADNNGIVSAVIHNPNTLAAFQMMHYELGPIMKAFALSTKALRIGALVNPMYWAKQLIRDPIHATLVGNSGIVTPFHALRDFVQVIAHASPEAKVLASRGVIGAIDPTTDIYDFIKKAGEERKDPNALQRAIHKVMRIHELSDAATRISVYKKALADAKSKGMNEDQAINFAVHKARESINFAVRGNSKVLNSARHMIPFISAQITSLDSVYRAMFAKHLSGAEKAEAQRAFRNGAMVMTILSAAYAMAYAGDEDYDKLPDVVKDNNWLIPNPLKEHTFIKIPIPFEVGYLFKSVPEASVRYMQGNSTGKEVLASYKNGLINNIPGGGLSPYHFLPQAIRPIIEVQSNYSNFTGRPIEGMSDQGKPVAFRGDRASEMAKFLSGFGLDKVTLSPAKIDYLIQAYTAELGTFTNSMASAALMQAEGKTAPSKNIEELPGFRAFMTNPNSSKAVADFYDLDHKAGELYSEFNTLRKTGQGAEAKSLLENEQQKKLIQAAPALRRIQTQMTNIHAQINVVTNDKSKSPDERRDIINKLEKQLDIVARQGYKVAQSAGINR